MDDKRDTDVRRPDGVLMRGETVGHVRKKSDGSTLIRKPDGIILRGEVVGEVDAKGAVRRPPGLILRGEQVGQVKGRSAHAPDGLLLAGQKWGYIDDEGNVRLRDGILFKGRIIGKVAGRNVAGALGHFVLRFDQLRQQCTELEEAVHLAKHKAGLLSRVTKTIERVATAEALGDFDALLRTLRDLQTLIEREVRDQLAEKTRLCEQAEALVGSRDWKQTGETLHRLHEQWKLLRSCGRESDEQLWQRFQRARETFFERRRVYFDSLDAERSRSRARKEQLCSQAEALADSSDWKSTAENLRSLMTSWKAAGHAGKEADDALWMRFRNAQDLFHTRRKTYFSERDREIGVHEAHLRRLTAQAAALSDASDHRRAMDRVKELQAEWKRVGFVPRDRSQPIWDEFRANCDRVFAQAREASERKQSQWREGQQEALERFRERAHSLTESIGHDLALIEHWEEVIGNLRGGSRADDIESSMREKIASVGAKVASKRDRLGEIEDIIEDIRRRLV